MKSSTARMVLGRCPLLAGVVGLALLAVAGGCNNPGQGKYTSEAKAQAQERMSMLKSGTEWQMAHQQFLAGEMDKAHKTIDKSIAMNPTVSKSHVLKGRILMEKGRLEEARESLLEAERLAADNVEAQYFLGIIHEQFSQPAEALARYLKAAELDVGNPQYVVAAAEMMVQQNRLDDAEQFIDARRHAFEYNAAIKQTLGHIAMLRGDTRLAAERFNEALLLAPDDTAILEDIAQAQMACGNFAEAEFAVTKLLQLEQNKDRRDLKQMRAKCLIALNRVVEARSTLLELSAEPEAARDVQTWIDLGNVAAVLKDKPHLRQAAQRAVALAPDRHEGYTLRGIYNRLEGRPEDALASFEQAVKRAGAEPSPYMLKALVLQDLGRPFEARQTIEQALAANPTSPRLQAMLASIDARTGAGNTVTGVDTGAGQP